MEERMERFKMRVAVHLILEKDNKILLLRRYNTGYEDGNYSVVAGHVDGNETIISAMKREAKEEAGINIEEEDLKIVQIMHRKSGDESIDYFLYANKFSGDIQIMEPNKCDELSFYSMDKLPKNIIPYINKAINNYKNNICFTEYGF
nr:NUDIX domain-containing protein [Clostridiales bacterium]